MKTLALPTADTTELRKQHTKTLLAIAAEHGIITTAEAKREDIIETILHMERMKAGICFMSDLQVGDRFKFRGCDNEYVVIGSAEGEKPYRHIYSHTKSYRSKDMKKVVLLTSKF